MQRIGIGMGLCVGLAAGVVLAADGPASGNMVLNGDFTQFEGAKPAEWAIVESGQRLSADRPEGKLGALRVEVTKDNGGTLGEVRQTLKVTPRQKYRLCADLKSTKAGMALIMLKPRASRKELARINSVWSTENWQTVKLEFDSGEADEVQVLCRYNQKAAFVGGSAWFTGIVLVPIDAAGNPLPVPPARSQKPAVAQAQAGAAVAPAAAPGTDQYVLPAAAGDGSGRDWAHARGAGALQAAIDAAGPGNTVFIGSGVYRKAALKMAQGGSGPDAHKTICGTDTGAGLPVFRSDFDKANPAKSGNLLLNVAGGVSHVTIRDLVVEDHSGAIHLMGGNKGVRIENVDVARSRDAFVIEGGGVDGGTSNLTIRNCDMRFYTKRGIRMRGGVAHAQIVNCHADAGGAEWATEPFAMGYQVGEKGIDVSDHHITFTDCSAANSYHDGGEKYWNADGFCAEGKSSDLTWVRCLAYGNTDGGWDIKSARPRWVDCIGIDNKRNFRVWSRPGDEQAVFENCLSAFTNDRGKRGHEAGFWIKTGGEVTLTRCTAWENQLPVCVEGEDPATTVTLKQCLIKTAAGGTDERIAAGTTVNREGTIVQSADGTPAIQLRKPSPTWRGGDDAFNAVSHPDAGYRWVKP
jgi:hypothetical protein